ncbi:dnaJ homolog subfamily C member 24 [Condylostylus longicornis]|uniref:dnaJ homolog subfamily C member 24 n=1 Tax=Condylostylus longicornis TaxID=2530218 RepID=UPI00244E39D8|nr:dnaJ homolog subfamily C member 24 [Condylostylus longicornis]
MNPLNYYEILNSRSSDSIQTIKENYQKLILLHHPDKKLVNKAWNVLRDPIKRKQYDALIYENEISLCNNVFAELDFTELKENYETDSSKFWTYQCRCGGSYIFEDLKQLDLHKLIEIECNECSLIIRVSRK